MKALVYYGPRYMKLADYDDPVPMHGEVLLKVKAVGICGSDVHGYLGLTGRRIPPMIMGHEAAAEVVQTTREDSAFQAGDLVFIDPITVCASCENCLEGNTSICLNKQNIGVLSDNGAFCEYIAVREENLIPVPDGVTAETAVLAEPFSVAGHAVNQLCTEARKAAHAAVIGAGVIGICTAAVLRERFPRAEITIMDVDANRLNRCRDILGDEIHTVDLNRSGYEEIRSRYTENGFDIVMEAVGVEPAVNGALTLVKSKGAVVLAGNNQNNIRLAYQQIITREIQISGTYGFTHQELVQSVNSFQDRCYAEKMVDAVIPLQEACLYFDRLAEKGHNFLKVVVKP